MLRRFLALVAALTIAACSRAPEGAGAPDAGAEAAPHKLGVFTYETNTYYWNESSSASASTTLIGGTRSGFENYDFINFDCKIVGPTGGPVDVYFQKRLYNTFSQANVWVDFIHFPQVAAGTTKYYNVSTDEYDATPLAVGWGTDDAGGVALAANTIAHGHPSDSLRLVTVTGTSVTVAAAITCYATARSRK